MKLQRETLHVMDDSNASPWSKRANRESAMRRLRKAFGSNPVTILALPPWKSMTTRMSFRTRSIIPSAPPRIWLHVPQQTRHLSAIAIPERSAMTKRACITTGQGITRRGLGDGRQQILLGLAMG